MPLKIIRADGAAERVQIESMRSRNTEAGQKIKEAAASIMQDIKQNGFSAVCKYSIQFDGAEPREITRSELDEAYAACDAALISALEEAARAREGEIAVLQANLGNNRSNMARVAGELEEQQSRSGGIAEQIRQKQGRLKELELQQCEAAARLDA